MSIQVIGTLILACAGLVSVVISFLMWRSTKQGSADANKISEEATKISERKADLDVMEVTIHTLRTNLNDAQQETNRLRDDLKQTRTETQTLRDEVTTALANVAILSDHIRENVSTNIPFPRLRRVSRSAHD